jgi:hypothetical protein
MVKDNNEGSKSFELFMDALKNGKVKIVRVNEDQYQNVPSSFSDGPTCAGCEECGECDAEVEDYSEDEPLYGPFSADGTYQGPGSAYDDEFLASVNPGKESATLTVVATGPEASSFIRELEETVRNEFYTDTGTEVQVTVGYSSLL